MTLWIILGSLVYVLFGWAITIQALPGLWAHASALWTDPCDLFEAALYPQYRRSNVTHWLLALLLAWPIAEPLRRLGARVDALDPRELERRARRIAQLERDLGMR